MAVLLPAKFRYLECPAALGSVRRGGMKLAESNVYTKHFRLQPEYKGTRRIKVTVCSVSVQLNGGVLAAYMSAYGSVEEVTTVHSADGTAHGNFVLNICLNRESFQAIPRILTYRDQQMMMVVEGRKPVG